VERSRLATAGIYNRWLKVEGSLFHGPEPDDHSTDSFLVEANADLDGRNVPFLRLEYVRKLGHDLVLPGDPDATYGVFQAQVGYAHRFAQIGPVVPAIGAVADIGAVPESVASAYGTSTPIGAFFFVALQPPKMSAGHEHHMSGM